MHSLAAKLTLAILVTGVIGALLVGVITSVQTRRAFDDFLFGRSRPATEAALERYYEVHGNWEGLGEAFRGIPGTQGRHGSPFLAIANTNGILVYAGENPERVGTSINKRALRSSPQIKVDGRVVGYIVFDPFNDRRLPDAPEHKFLYDLNRSILLASMAAAIMALILGALLARTLTQPIRELTAATQQIADGQLGIQVTVHTHDEVGKLTESFNNMSADLERSSLQRKQMTANIAHDLRTPLSVILGYTEALSDGKLNATPEIAETLHREAQHLNHLIEELRTLSLADTGDLQLHRSLIEPVPLLERTVSSYRMQADEQGIELNVEAMDELPTINVDSQRMAQVLGNLVSNALRHTPSGGSVTLSATSTVQDSQLSVRDTGSGIAPDDLPHVFSRFYRADTARTGSGASGLGLSIAKSIVEAHGGTIEVSSVPGQGSQFTIKLPVEGKA